MPVVSENLRGKTLVDVTNPVTHDRRNLTIGHRNSAEEIARHFGKSHVVEAFNAVFAEVYARQTPHIDGRSVDLDSRSENGEIIPDRKLFSKR